MVDGSAIGVHHEWGALREAIVGLPSARLGSGIPRLAANYMPAASLQLAAQVLAANAGRTLAEAMPELQHLAAEQMAAASAVLESRGVTVHHVAQMLPAEEAYLAELEYGNISQYFPRDPVLVVGDTFLETSMRYPSRRGERFAIRRTLDDRLRGTRRIALPEPQPLPEQPDGSFGPGPFLEGGDVLLFGEDILVGLSGNASNEAGVAHLQAALGHRYRVHPVRLSSSFLHLDCVLAAPREGLALACREAFPDGLPEILKDWDILEVAPEAAEQRLAANILVLDETCSLVAEETPETAEALASAGVEVLTVPFGAVFLWGGAFRCWHHPLRRDS